MVFEHEITRINWSAYAPLFFIVKAVDVALLPNITPQLREVNYVFTAIVVTNSDSIGKITSQDVANRTVPWTGDAIAAVKDSILWYTSRATCV